MIGIVGLFAQLIDGALGMSYGVTSTSLLLTIGVAPAVASASVHLAEIGTTLASGTAHWRFGNVDWRVVGLLAAPGFMGAFIGAVVLSSLSAETAKPVVSGILLVLGIYVIWRFARSSSAEAPRPSRVKGVFMAPLGLIAGDLIDSVVSRRGCRSSRLGAENDKLGRPLLVVGMIDGPIACRQAARMLG